MIDQKLAEFLKQNVNLILTWILAGVGAGIGTLAERHQTYASIYAYLVILAVMLIFIAIRRHHET